MNLEDEYKNLKYLLEKKKLTYSEFNEIIGNYYVKDYEEIDDNYYIIKILCSPSFVDNIRYDYYTDYIELLI